MAGSEYPKRERFFSHRAVRLMLKTCLANEIGPTAVWLLTVIAHTEDAAGYRRAITWYDNQLIGILGVGSRKGVSLARKKAVEAGWLHYEPGHKGKASKYWVTVPESAEGLDDLPTDEGYCGSNLPPIGTSNEPQRNLKGTKSEPQTNLKGRTSLPIPVPIPIPDPNTSARAEPTDFERFYLAYPRHVAPKKALAAWEVAAKNVPAEQIIAAAVAFAASPKGQSGRFCPHPATWLNQGRYLDDQSDWHQQEKSSDRQHGNPGRVYDANAKADF